MISLGLTEAATWMSGVSGTTSRYTVSESETVVPYAAPAAVTFCTTLVVVVTARVTSKEAPEASEAGTPETGPRSSVTESAESVVSPGLVTV